MKIAIVLVALFVVAANAAIVPVVEVQHVEARANHEALTTIRNITKEIKNLVRIYEQCQSIDNDSLKGTCFTKFSQQLGSDIETMVDAILKLIKVKGDGWDLTKEITVLLAKSAREVQNLIGVANECQTYSSETRRGTCWTRFSLELASSIANITNSIIDLVLKEPQKQNNL